MPLKPLLPWTKIRMVKLTRRKCDLSLIVAKAAVKDSADRVKAAKVVAKASGAQVKAVKAAPVPVVVKTHADPAKAIEISLVPAAVMPKAY